MGTQISSLELKVISLDTDIDIFLKTISSTDLATAKHYFNSVIQMGH